MRVVLWGLAHSSSLLGGLKLCPQQLISESAMQTAARQGAQHLQARQINMLQLMGGLCDCQCAFSPLTQVGGVRRLYIPGELAFPKPLKAAAGRWGVGSLAARQTHQLWLLAVVSCIACCVTLLQQLSDGLSLTVLRACAAKCQPAAVACHCPHSHPPPLSASTVNWSTCKPTCWASCPLHVELQQSAMPRL